MKNLLISGDSLQEWVVEEILEKTKNESVKDKYDKVQMYDYFIRQERKDFHKLYHLEEEYKKRI